MNHDDQVQADRSSADLAAAQLGDVVSGPTMGQQRPRRKGADDRALEEITASLDQAEAMAAAAGAASGGESWSADTGGSVTVDDPDTVFVDPVFKLPLPPLVAEFEHDVVGRYGAAWDPAAVMADLGCWRAVVAQCATALEDPKTQPFARALMQRLHERWLRV